MKTLLLFSLLLTFSCLENKENKTKSYLEINNQPINNDSIKGLLKEKIITQYMSISITELSKENVKYNNYTEFKILDSLFNEYNKTNLTLKDKQYLGIVKAKRFLLTGNYEDAISKLISFPDNIDIDDYKKLLLGISHYLNGDLLSSNKTFEELLEKVDSLGKDNDDCPKYLLLNVLADRDELIRCKTFIKEYRELKLIDKNELIRMNFLNNLEL